MSHSTIKGGVTWRGRVRTTRASSPPVRALARRVARKSMRVPRGCARWRRLAWVGRFKRRFAIARFASSHSVALMCSSLSVILFVPTPAHGDITDFGHRPFVLVYLVAGALAGAAAVRLLVDWTSRRFSSSTVAAVAVGGLALAGLAAPWIYGAKVQQRWWPPYALNFVDRDALEAGRFVRGHSTAGDQILATGEDPLAVLVALTERRAYLSRTSLYRLLGGAATAATDERAREHATVGAVTSFDQLKAFGAKTGVSWYIADTPATLLWPDVVTSRCVYCGNTVRVYDLR